MEDKSSLIPLVNAMVTTTDGLAMQGAKASTGQGHGYWIPMACQCKEA